MRTTGWRTAALAGLFLWVSVGDGVRPSGAYEFLDGQSFGFGTEEEWNPRWSPAAWGPGETIRVAVPDNARWVEEFEIFQSMADVRQLVSEALSQWSAIGTADIRWTLAGPGVGEAPVSVQLREDRSLRAAGRARLFSNPENLRFLEIQKCDIYILYPSVGQDRVPVRGTVAHELGHCLGLGHHWGRAQRLTATSYVVSGLSAETEHAFRVFAWHRSSGGVDDRSPAVDTTATTLAADPPDLTVGDETMNSVSLSWSEIADATGYELERRSPFESGAWSVVYGPGSERTHEDTGLDAGTSYGYQVRATLPGDRRTRWSTEAEAMTDAGLPPVPMDVTAHGVSSSMIEVRWTAVDGVTRYRVQRRPDGGGGGGDWVAVASVDPAEFPAYRDSELPADTAYDYRVRSVLEVDGETRRSEWSEPVSGRTDP